MRILAHISLSFVAVSGLSCLLGTIGCKDPVGPPSQSPVDTTSHDFVWTIDTLGDGASSVLFDVTLINQNTAWAAGEIRFRDSSGQWTIFYNYAEWDGTKWNPRAVPFPQYNYDCTFAANLVSPATATYALDSQTLLLSDGGATKLFYTDSSWQDYGCQNLQQGQFRKIWGLNGSDFYLVGWNGTIVSHSENGWRNIPSNTNLDIHDIWGAIDPVTSQPDIIAIASQTDINQGLKLLQIHQEIATTLPDTGLSWGLRTVWFVPGKAYYLGGYGLFKRNTDGTWSKDVSFPPYFIDAIRGNNENDVVVVGSNGLFSHYNGSTWKHYLGSGLPSFAGHYYSVAIKGNTVVAVGYVDNKAIAVVGRRLAQ